MGCGCQEKNHLPTKPQYLRKLRKTTFDPQGCLYNKVNVPSVITVTLSLCALSLVFVQKGGALREI